MSFRNMWMWYLCLMTSLLKMGQCEEVPNVRPSPSFGWKMRKEFYMEPDFTFVNHGSFGTYPKVVGTALRKYQERAEKNPDLWFIRELKPELANVRRLIAKLVGTNAEDIVIVPNTTSGMNAVLRSMVFSNGERILYLNIGSMSSLINYIVNKSNGTVSKVVFNATYPTSNDAFLRKFENFLDKVHDPSRPIRIAVIDHIASIPAVLIPIEKIIPMLKQRNISVAIDGAHGPGCIPVNITALDPDYYVGGCHKWLYVPRGMDFLYVKKQHQSTIHPALINNHAYQQPGDFFQNAFFWTGTTDYSHYMTIPTALKFRESVGGESSITQYNHDLAYVGGLVMAKRFKTRVLQDEDQVGSMVDVQLPVSNPDDPRLSFEWWTDEQLVKYPNLFAPVYKHNGVWWVRVSAQIYNTLADFEDCADHFMRICDEINGLGNATMALNEIFN